MRLPQALPGDGGGPEYEHFSYWSIAGGQKHFAYTAGPCQWFHCHPSERTKPCLFKLTGGEVPCARCGGKKPRAICGYLPVWRAVDWRPKLVVLYEPEREWVDPMRLHLRVQIGREDEKGAPLYVRPALTQDPPFNTTIERRKQPQDIWRSLLLAWELPELNVWFQSRGAVSDNAVSLDKPAAPVPAAPVPEQVVVDRPQPYQAPAADVLGDEYVEVVNRIRKKAGGIKPSTNGQH